MGNIKISISTNNKKMGAIPSISFPPIKTCCNCAECCTKCYALKMCKRRKTTATAWQNNLNAWNENPKAVEIAILNSAIISGYFRYFVGGDIINDDFFKMMVRVAKQVKTCKFLAFTKNFEVVNNYLKDGHKIPKNLIIIFSEWGASVPNPYNLPTSKVIFKGQEPPENGLICGGNCANCICRGVGCWQLKKGQSIYFYEH